MDETTDVLLNPNGDMNLSDFKTKLSGLRTAVSNVGSVCDDGLLVINFTSFEQMKSIIRELEGLVEMLCSGLKGLPMGLNFRQLPF